MAVDAVTAVEGLYRSEWGRIVATLIGLVGDFDLAEESAQEAFAAAVDQWRAAGVPEFPAGLDHPDRPPQGDRPAAAPRALRRQAGVPTPRAG